MMPSFPRPSLSFRTAGFPRYGWKAGISGAFPRINQLKPAYGSCLVCIRRSCTSWSYSVVPCCVGPRTQWCTAMEGGSPSAPGALAPVRVMLSRTVTTQSTPSVPLAGTSRFHRKAAYRRYLRAFNGSSPLLDTQARGRVLEIGIRVGLGSAVLWRVANRSHRQTNLGAGRKKSQPRRNHSKNWMLAGIRGGDTIAVPLPNIGSMGGECGPLRKGAMAERLCRRM
jgi:hypothetical protein